MDELDEEANEAHDAETDRGGERDLLEFLSVGLGALLDESIRVLKELLAWLDDFVDLVHLLFFQVSLFSSNLKNETNNKNE